MAEAALDNVFVDDITFPAADLKKAGFEVKTGTDAERKLRKVQAFFSFTDPAGLRHEVSWGPIAGFTKFVSPIGTKFVTDNLGLGHAVLL